MKIGATLELSTDELTPRAWRKLFSKMRFQVDQEIFEPWMIYPHKHKIILPRGAWTHLPDDVRYADNRVCPPMRKLDFTGELDSEGFDGQLEALTQMLEQEQGLVIAQPGFGKTQVVLAFASVIETPTLVLVHTKDILKQWQDRISAIVPDAEIGLIQGKTCDVREITVSTIQTFRRVIRYDKDLRTAFGCVILDEAHHAPAETFDEVLNVMPAKYRFGVTATDKRADGRHPYMKLVFGPVIYRHKFVSKIPVEVVPVKSHKFYYGFRGSWDWRNLVDALISNPTRNMTIAARVDRAVRDGHICLVLSREIQHLENIRSYMNSSSEMLTGERNQTDRNEILDRFRLGTIPVVFATQLADEALDVPILSCIALTYPGKHDGRIIQQVGRALREHPLKSNALILDVVDDRVGVLRRQWMLRKQAYKQMKIPVRKVKR
jgi:superfamily II DNA or RNA helicase